MNTKSISILAAGVLLCAACSNSDEEELILNGADQMVRFTVATRSGDTETTTGTTATPEPLAQGTTVRISRDLGKTYYNYTSDADGNLTPDAAEFVKWDATTEKTISIFACAPAEGGEGEEATAESFVLPTDQSNGTAVADFATYVGNISRIGTSLGAANYNDATFTLEHRLSRVKISISGADAKYADCTFTLQVYSPASGVEVIYSTLDGAATVKPVGSPVLVTPESNAGLTTTFGQAVAIVTPGEASQSTKFVEVQAYDAKQQPVGSPMYTTVRPALLSGKSYTFKLQVHDDGLYIGNVSVAAWDEVDAFDAAEDAALSANYINITNLTASEIRAKVNAALTEDYTELYFSGTKAEGVSTLEMFREKEADGFPAITKLDLSKCELSAIEDYTFYGASFSEILLPNNLTSFGMCAFYNCSSLEEVHVPSAVTSVGAEAFRGCTSLKVLDVPGATTIGAGLIKGASAMSVLMLPKVTTIITEGTMTESASLFDGVTEEVAANITLVLNQALEADIENINFKAVYLVDDEGIVTSTTNGDKSYVGKSYTEIKIESTNEDNEQ